MYRIFRIYQIKALVDCFVWFADTITDVVNYILRIYRIYPFKPKKIGIWQPNLCRLNIWIQWNWNFLISCSPAYQQFCIPDIIFMSLQRPLYSPPSRTFDSDSLNSFPFNFTLVYSVFNFIQKAFNMHSMDPEWYCLYIYSSRFSQVLDAHAQLTGFWPIKSRCWSYVTLHHTFWSQVALKQIF